MKSRQAVCYEIRMSAAVKGLGVTPFHDIDTFLALPRVSGLAVSPDGSRVLTTVSQLNDKRTEFVGAIWELDPAGQQPARRITHGPKGESAPELTVDNDMLFLAVRPVPDDDSPPRSLWRLPADGGEATEVLTLPAGVDSVLTARATTTTVVGAAILAATGTVEDDRRLRTLRKDNKVSAVLHSGYPVRYWDHDLGPGRAHLFKLVDGEDPLDLTPTPGDAVREADVDVSRDGSFLVTTWRRPGPGAAQRTILVRIDLDTGHRVTVVDDPDADLAAPAIAPDGKSIAYTRETLSTPTSAPRITLWLKHFDGQPTELTGDWDRWPTSVTWADDGSSLIVTADDNGRGPVFVVDPSSGAVRRLVADDFTYTDVKAAPAGVLYALRSSYTAPPHPVRIDPDGAVTVLPCVDPPDLPGTVEDVTATTSDGQNVRSWLALPHGDGPAPLLVWIHGGPLASWNAWHWRWNPWVMVAAGYSVLLPDPALSTGYGQQFIQRGWGAWGGAPYTDVMTATDGACAHPRVDASRTAAMGGSFGGYLANWIAGHTDRFSAIVTHASLWALDQFGATTDGAYWWAREMTPEMAAANSPHHFVSDIATPMLVIHGDKDYRVPIGEALRLWYELLSASGLPAAEDGSTEHRFLYFPSENHWVLNPQHAKLWYQVVLAFLAAHLLDEHAQWPEMLG